MNKKNKIILSIIFVIIFVVLGSFIYQSQVGDEHSSENITNYYCPMHPQVNSTKPSVCPICQMDLVKKNETPSSEMMVLTLSEAQQVVAKIRNSPAIRMDLPLRFTVNGLVTWNENSKKIISARIMGRIEKVYQYSIGSPISQGTMLYKIYSDEFIQAQLELISAMNTGNTSAITSVRKKILRMGVTQSVIDRIAANKEVEEYLDISSPYNGVITNNNAVEGQYVEEGYTLFEVADLSMVQVIAQVFPSQINKISTNSNATISVNGDENTIKARVAFIYPETDPNTKLVKVRLDVPNRNHSLKINMNVFVNFTSTAQNVIVVPNSAIVVKGTKSLVWLKRGKDAYFPNIVIVGSQNDEFTEIISGVTLKDTIAFDGTYLLDSEAQLKWGEYQNSLHKTENINIEPISEESGNSETALKDKEVGSKIFNKFCPILGEEIDEKVPTVEYKGKNIGFCCKGCDKKFLSNPELYLKNLSTDGSKFIGTIVE